MTRVAMRQIVGRDDHVGEDSRERDAPVDMLDHRPAAEVRESFAGESRRGVSGGDDGDDGERRNRIDP
jgi:hypothetical protein